MPPPIRHDAKTRLPGDKYGAPGTSFPTPNVEDIIVVEEVPMRTANYLPLEYGTQHPTISRAKLTFQAPVKGNNLEKNVRRIYSTARAGQNAYNYALSFQGSGFPTIIRSYVLRRDGYEPLADYSSDPDFAGAVLTKEEMGPVGEQELTSLDVKVTRIYEVLPGPWIYSVRYDDNLGPVQQRRRAVRTDPGAVGDETATSKTSYEARENSVLVSWQIEENWSDGSETPGNPSYPTLQSAEYDRERGKVYQGSQLAVIDSANVSLSGSGEITEIGYTPYSPFLSKKNITVYTLPGPILTAEPEDDFEKGPIEVKTQLLVRAGTEAASIAISGSVVAETTYENVNVLVERKVTKTYTLPGPLRTSVVFDDFTSSLVAETRQLVAASTSIPALDDKLTDFQSIPVNDVTKRFVTRTYPTSLLSDPAVIEFFPDRFVYPAIWHGMSGTITEILANGGVYIESERPISMSAMHSTVFTTTAPTATTAESGIVNLLPIRHNFASGTVSSNTGPVLCDSFTIGLYVAQASSPTAGDYVTERAAGHYMVQSRPAKKLAKALWAVTTISIPYR